MSKKGRALMVKKNVCYFLLLFVMSCVQAKEVYHFEPEIVTVVGTVTLKKFPGPPNYGEGPDDKKVDVPILLLPQAIDVVARPDATDDNPDSETEKNVGEMQIILPDQPVRLKGCIALTGTLMHQVTAGHYTSVLIVMKSAKPGRRCGTSSTPGHSR
ncbi:hypothetical protein PMPD1_0736 [Paramixta manurensis]|uniref:DUF4431 domain-containing protein n=1 Tax=Paramixta manurensis TaxID=2740817 RepID=A0A6M8U4Y9_9GAMM|nr:hypothetical protein PMPD1_0736 [Erwiniaceae bacterium PD-1]